MITVEKMQGETPFQKEANYILTKTFISLDAPLDECLYLAQRIEGKTKEEMKKEIKNSFYTGYSSKDDFKAEIDLEYTERDDKILEKVVDYLQKISK